MNIQLLCVRKTSEKYLKDGEGIYLNRLAHYCKLEKKIISDLKNKKTISALEIKKKEGLLILKNINPSDFLVVLDEKGGALNSVEFSSNDSL